MTRDAGGGGFAPPQPPPIDVDGIWQAHLETCARVERAFRETLGLAPEVDLQAFGERYAMAAGSERPAPVWPAKRPSEHELKREVLAIEQKARAALDNPGSLTIGNLVAALNGARKEIFRSLPEAVFVQLESRTGAPSATLIARLAATAAAVAALVPAAPKTHAGLGRPSNVTALSFAVMLARDFQTLTGRPASFDGSKDSGGRYAELVANVFAAAGLGANPMTSARAAVRRLREIRPPKSGLPK